MDFVKLISAKNGPALLTVLVFFGDVIPFIVELFTTPDTDLDFRVTMLEEEF